LARASPVFEYDDRNGLSGDEMFHMFEDRQADLWISTRSADPNKFGLSRWNRAANSFHTFSAVENFPTRKSVSAFAEDELGQLWFGFYEGGLVRYVGERFTEITTDEQFLADEMVSALHIDRKGRLWISSNKSGLARIDDIRTDRPKLIRYNSDNGLSSNNVRSLAEDNYGQIYAGTARGVDRITPGSGRIRHYSTADGLAGDFVQASFRDRNGVMWFGTPNGISKLVPTAENRSSAPPVWFSALRIAGENRTIAKLGSIEIIAEELAPQLAD
jgi:ligand-binding sensor domain-containing protein